MQETFDKTAEQAAAFQKMWVESMSRVMQAAFTVSPNSPPPDVVRQIRSGKKRKKEKKKKKNKKIIKKNKKKTTR